MTTTHDIDSNAHYYDLAINHVRSKQLDSAIYYQQKLERLVANGADYRNLLLTYGSTGHQLEEMGAIEKSIKLYFKGYQIAKNQADILQMSQMFIEISNAYRIFHNYQKAIEYGKEALHILDKDTTNNLFMKTSSLSMIAAGFTEIGQPDSALVYHLESMEYLPKMNPDILKSNMINLGYAYLELNMLPECKYWTERGLELYRPIQEPYALGTIYTNLAMYGNRANELQYALQMFDSALYYTGKSNYIETLFWIYEERAEVYKKLKMYDKAFDDLQSLIQVKDSVFVRQRDQTTQEMEAKYQTDKKEQQIALQQATINAKNAELNVNRLVLASMIAGIILAILFGLLFRNRMLLKQEKALVEEKNKAKEAQIKASIQSQEKERNRFAKDLHDNIGQLISVMNMSVVKLQKTPDLSREERSENYNTCSSVLSDMYKELKNVCFDLMPHSLQNGGLIVALEEFANRINAIGQIQIELITYGEYDYPANDQTVSQYRICQEWINNIIKYSDARQITIQVIQDDEEILLMIEDDGMGFDSASLANGKGYGWKNIHSRANFINGIIALDTRVGRRGNTFTLTIPKLYINQQTENLSQMSA